MKNNCTYCGNNPVPHWLNWYYESLDVLLAPVRRWLLYNRAARVWKRFLRKLKFSLRLTRTLLAVRVLSGQADRARCRVRRAQVLWEEADKRGIKMTELLLFGKPFDCYLAEKRSETKNADKFKSEIVFNGLPRPENYTGVALDMMDDKALLKAKLAAAGLPVPRGGSTASWSGAVKLFRSTGKPAIVKPRTGSRGRHTTTFVCNEEELYRAFRAAKQLCFWVIVEEQLFGPVFRATVINNRLAGVLRGDPPSVTGDGEHSINELINIKNTSPHPGVKDIKADASAETFLSRQNLTLSSVPAAGQTVNLSEKIGVNYGGSSSEDFEICHPDNKELFLRAAAVLGDPIVGFDYIIPDIAKSYKEQRTGFIEANSLPFINLHHDPLHGQPRNPAALVWDMLGW